MLIIGHRGAAGLAPENSLPSLHAGYAAGADALEFDIRLTKDGVPILLHDKGLRRTHQHNLTVSRATLEELIEITADLPNVIATLEQVLDEFFGKVLLNIELKQKNSAQKIIEQIESKYIQNENDWKHIVLSSFMVDELKLARRASSRVPLWMLHGRNPFLFMAYWRKLHLSGVGFHRPYLHPFAVKIAHRLNLFTYVFTINRLASAKQVQKQKIAGIVTDYPDKMAREFRAPR